MRAIVDRIRRDWSQSLHCLLVAFFALAAAQTAHAAYWDWKGKSGATSCFDDVSCWHNEGSASSLSGSNHWFGYGKATVANTTVTSTNFFSLSGTTYVKGKTFTFVATAADKGINSSADIEIGKDANATAKFQSGTYKFAKVLIGSSTSGNTGALQITGGTFSTSGDVKMGSQGDATLTMDGGTMTVATWTRFENSSHSKTINLNGGTLTTYYINSQGTSGTQTVLFNGGTLKRRVSNSNPFIHANIAAKVGANGGTINLNSFDTTINANFSDNDASAPGGMTFCGGGNVTLAGAVGYTGGTTIEAGTTIKVDTAAKKDAILGNGLNTLKVIPTTDGTFTLVTITGDGTFSDSDLLKVAVAPGVAGTAAFSLSNDRKSLMATVSYAGGEINQSTPTLVFPGKTLADLATHTLRARMQGGHVNDNGVEVTFFNRTETEVDGVLTKVTYQLQALDESYVKCVYVDFTADATGVYAKLADGNYGTYGGSLNTFGTEPLTSNAANNRQYYPYDFRLVEPVGNSINLNFTHTDGSDLDSTSSVRYGGGDYAVPYSSWANMPAGQSGTMTVGGATVNITKSSGQFRCVDLNKTKDLRYGYLDDSGLTVVVDVTDIPYEFYRIVTYHASDVTDLKFGYVTINGVNYTGGTDATVKGTSSWGHTGARNKAKGLREGVNYLVSDVMIASSATITGHRDKASGPTARGCIAAIQIVEYVPTTYTATIGDGGAKTFSALDWDKTLPAALTAGDQVVINVNEDTTLTLDSALDVYAIKFNVADGKTLTLAGSNISAQYITATGAGQTVVASASQLAGIMKGDGTLVYDGFKPAASATFTDAQWTGTLWVKNIATDSNERKDWTLANYGNAASTIRFTSVNLYFASGTTSFPGTVDLDGAGMNVCDGYGGSITTIARLTGDGTLSTSGGSANGNGLTINDISGFTGTLDLTMFKVIVGTSTGTSASGVLQIDAGQTVAIADGKTWTARYGVDLNGTLMLGAGAVAPAVVSGTGTVGVASGTGTINGYGTAATLVLATAPGATLAVSDNTLETMTVLLLNNQGTIDLRGTALAELDIMLAPNATVVAPGTILYPATFEKFVALPADSSIRSLAGFTAPALPEGAAYCVTLAETREEYGKGSLTVTDAAEGVNVRVVRVADGTIVDLTPEGGTATLTGAPRIAGAATAFDFTYTNTVDLAYQAPGLDIGRNWDGSKSTPMTYNNSNADKTTGAHIKHHPWVTGAGNLVHDLENFTIVLVGTMSPSHNTQFFHMGATGSGQTGLLIATTENDNQVLIAKNMAATVDAEGGVRAAVPNAATARHAYVIYKKGTVFEVWVDGVKRGQFDGGEDFTLSAGGMQVGSDHGGNIKSAGIYQGVPVNDDETGYVNVLRMFDYSISDAQAEAVFAEYPYVSQGGLYMRAVAADGAFSETGVWEKEGDANRYAVPEGATVEGVYYNPSATLTVDAEATMTVNADATLENFTVGGSAALKFAADGAHTLSVVNAAIVNLPITNEYGAVYLAGAPVQLGSSGSICFDCSSLDVSKVYTVTRFQLTGLIDRNDEKVSIVPPTDPDRSYELVYNTSGSCYDLVVTPLRDYVVAENKHTSLAVTEDTIIVGAGGFRVDELSIPANGKLTFDPVKTPLYVASASAGALSIGEGVKFALAPAYSGMTLGRIVLMTYKEDGITELPADLNDLFDASSIAPGATYAVTSMDAPDPTGGRKQLVLTVGDYDRDAKEIVVAAVGDSITQGVANSAQNDYPQYRTAIAAYLAANGYKPKFRGIWCKSNYDAAHVQVPDDWAYHCGFGMAAVRTTEKSGGLADNMPLYLDIAGYPDVITLLIGTNDMGANGKEAGETFTNYLALVNATAAQRPNAKIVGATILPRPGGAGEKVQAFNALLCAEYAKEGKGELPDNFFLIDLYPLVPNDANTSDTVGNYKGDNVHPNWKGNAIIAEAFYGKIAELCPLATFAGAGDATVTDLPQTALGAATIDDLTAYRDGMTHVFTIEKDGAAGATNCFTSSPYTAIPTPVALTRPVSKVGYYMELVRKGTNRRRWVWVDMDATGMTLGEVDFPWNKQNMQRIATKLHVKSNYAGIHDVAADDDSICGFVEGTMYNYQNQTNNIEGVPADIFGADKYGWNDTMGTSGGHACFQVHRLFSQTGADTSWNDAEVLFAWNKWGSDKAGYVDNIGIGTFACHVEAVSGGIKTTDYTFTENCTEGGFADAVTSDAYSIRRLEIWATVEGETRHGAWTGFGGDGDFDNAANWEDGIVPADGENIDFSSIPAATTISVTGASADKTFGTVTMGKDAVTFVGAFKATSFSDTSKVAVGANSTVTLDGDLEFSGSGYQYVVNTVAAGGKFVVTGDIIAMSDFTGYLFHSKTAGAGAVQARGVANNATSNSDAWAFRLSADSGTDTANWIIGDHGLFGSKGLWTNGDRPIALRPLDSNFTITAKVGIYAGCEFNTTGADGNPYTITIGDGSNGHFERTGAMTVTGTGTLLVNYNHANYYNANNTHPITVANGATLAINAGKCPTTGAITVQAGGTLKVSQSATVAGDPSVTLGGGLTLADGACLGFNFTNRRNAPVLNVTGNTVTADGTVYVKASANNHPVAGEYPLTFGGKFAGKTVVLADDAAKWAKRVYVEENGEDENGEIVVTVKPMRMAIYLR